MILIIFDLKKGIGTLVKKAHEQVKTKGYAATDGNFLSHAHYRDPYFNFNMRVIYTVRNIECKIICLTVNY